MTNQQAITLLRNLEQSLDDYCELNDEGKTAFSKAITALELFGNSEQLPSAQANTSNALESLDCIDRQAAIDAVNKALDRETLLYGFVRKVVIDAIRLLPSSQPAAKDTNVLNNDCISRQAAIEVADAIWCVTGDKNVAKVWAQLKDLPSAQPEQRWIHVTERLPEDEQNVLVTYKTTDKIHPCQYHDDGSRNPWYSYIDQCRAHMNVVLAWMPLPEPYMRGEQDERTG